jgi:hypothetical protein
MNSSKSKIALVSLIAAASAVAGVASAENSNRLSDMAYIAAARCEGLAQGAKVDTAGIKALMSNQDSARIPYVLDKADQAREDAKRQASHAQGYSLQTVNAELSGACQAYLKS